MLIWANAHMDNYILRKKAWNGVAVRSGESCRPRSDGYNAYDWLHVSKSDGYTPKIDPASEAGSSTYLTTHTR